MLFSECNYSVDNYNPNWNTTLHMEHAVLDFSITAHALDQTRENTTEANTRLPINTDPRAKPKTKRGKTKGKKKDKKVIEPPKNPRRSKEAAKGAFL